MHAPAYHDPNAGALAQDWPRIPLPTDQEALAWSTDLGRQLVVLLDIEQDVPGISSGPRRADLRAIAVPGKRGGGVIDPDAGDLRVDVNWGYRGRGGVVMPARGKTVERTAAPEEGDLLGVRTVDVYLNDDVRWSNVPEPVWEYTLGGYQVLKKWLSYRESDVLGRDLQVDEGPDLSEIARRIARILLMEDELNVCTSAASADTLGLAGCGGGSKAADVAVLMARKDQ